MPFYTENERVSAEEKAPVNDRQAVNPGTKMAQDSYDQIPANHTDWLQFPSSADRHLPSTSFNVKDGTVVYGMTKADAAAASPTTGHGIDASDGTTYDIAAPGLDRTVTVHADGSCTENGVRQSEGTWSKNKSDGSEEFTFKNGDKLIVKPDGVEILTEPASDFSLARTTTRYPSGVQLIEDSNGKFTLIEPDGRTEPFGHKQSDGSITFNGGLQTETLKPDGTVIYDAVALDQATKASISTLYPNGLELINNGEQKIFLTPSSNSDQGDYKSSDGSTEISKSKDGAITLKVGNDMRTIAPDGTMTFVHDGKTETEKPAQVTKEPEGSRKERTISWTYADGTKVTACRELTLYNNVPIYRTIVSLKSSGS